MVLQGIGWVFTVNNPSEPLTWPEDVRYAIYQLEQGESGTVHFQGYVEFHKRTRLTRVREILPRAHWETRRGTAKQARAYCVKQDSTYRDGPWEHGTMGSQGVSSDLLTAAEMIAAGSRPSAIAGEYPTTWIRYGRGLLDLALRLSPPRSEPPTIYVLWGSTGSGKSRWAFDNYDAEDIYIVPGQGEWMDSYEQQKVVMFDEFYGGIPWSELLKLTDRYPHKAKTKGSFVNFNPSIMVFTSNRHPRDWYQNIQCHAAFARRVTSVIKMGDPDYMGHQVNMGDVEWPDHTGFPSVDSVVPADG